MRTFKKTVAIDGDPEGERAIDVQTTADSFPWIDLTIADGSNNERFSPPEARAIAAALLKAADGVEAECERTGE